MSIAHSLHGASSAVYGSSAGTTVYAFVGSISGNFPGLLRVRERQMTWAARVGCGAMCVLLLLFSGVNRARAWGALAIGKTYEDTQTATAGVVGKATEDEARQAALKSCRTAKNKSDAARSACVD